MSTRRALFAEYTKVPVTQTRLELEALLKRYGADQSLFGSEVGRAVIGFRIKGLQIKIVLKLPRGTSAQDAREERRMWRALLLVIKAKLEACHSGIAVIEDEFAAYVVMPMARRWATGPGRRSPPCMRAAGCRRYYQGLRGSARLDDKASQPARPVSPCILAKPRLDRTAALRIACLITVGVDDHPCIVSSWMILGGPACDATPDCASTLTRSRKNLRTRKPAILCSASTIPPLGGLKTSVIATNCSSLA
jgi:hypothetical protein